MSKKAVGYARVSTAGQAKEGESLETQRQQIADFAKQKGWELVDVYSDEGISGAKIDYREGFKQMLQDAEAGKFDVIIFTKLSRFARNAREYLNFSHDLEKQGVLLASIKENIDPTTKTGKMIAGILALFAEWEHDTIQEQMYENRNARWKDQRAFIGQPPYGYRWNKEKQELEIHEEEAEIYRWVVRMYVDQRMSFRDITMKLKEHGIKCKRAEWSNAAVSFMLKNPAYYGHYVVNQYEYEDGPQGAGTVRTKRKKPASEHIVFQIPPIISKSRWDQIQERTQFNKIKSKRSHNTKDFFLRDMLVCGRCGGRVKPRLGSKRKDGTAPRYYVCYWAGTSLKNVQSAGREEKCSLPFIPAKDIENAVWADILVMFALNPKRAFGRLFDPEAQKEKINDLEERIKRLENNHAKKKRARDNLYKFLEDEDMDHEELRQKLRQNKDELLEIESALEDARTELEETKGIQERQAEAQKFFTENKENLKQLRREIRRLDYEDRKLLVEAMLTGDIVVDYQEDDPEEGPGGAHGDYHLRFNTEILQRFIDEGKITKLGKNGPHYLNLIHNLKAA